MSCDFHGNDLSNVLIAPEFCSGKCGDTQGCTHFTWTQYNGGTCWMKSGAVSKSDAFSTSNPTMVCGVINDVKQGGIQWNGNDWAMSCDFRGNDLSNVLIAANICGGKCADTQRCTHFTWTQYNGGTCWMKSGAVSKSDAVSTSDPTMVCGVTKNSPIEPPTSGVSKRGIAWPPENKQDSPNIFTGGKISWMYNWSPFKINVAGIEFVPMLWSTNKGHDGSQFYNQAKGAKIVLGFNEPERGDQANMNPVEAASAWKQYIEPLRAQGARLGSPAIASTDQGLNWLKQFLNELDKVGGKIDFLALHWYGRGVDNFINWITKVRGELGNKYSVWVTEFACTSWNPSQPVSQQEVNDFMRQSVAKLDSLNWVERYAWFGAQRQLDPALGSTNCLIAPNGQLSALGQQYVYGL
ncbi:unnamed protein product [Rotaria sordida]|uniref:Asl1-like glycosyl hydrolase catalytic domain-containing protein n=1 Tax=Rotaria sordida TaxID=392033 RepID=A0A813WRM8_9BILA|nr:unnamed protein product [Rotaria sordida]CAF3536127.1 unnamed protein product [Rotaria sordida]